MDIGDDKQNHQKLQLGVEDKCQSSPKYPVQNDEMDTDEELGPMPHTEDNTGATAATVTSETLYVEGGPSVQTRLLARVITVPKRGKRTRCTGSS